MALGPIDAGLLKIPELPSSSGSVKDFIPYLSSNPNKSLAELLEPYKAFESELRKVYAQQPDHEAVKDGNVNLVPIFAGHEQEVKIRARSLDTETEDEKSKYIMQLKDEDRKPNGAPAIVSSFRDFQQNFNLFSESSLADLDWSNVVAAGSAVTTALLPVPEKWSGNKRSLREYYHQHLAPASDVDLFIYGLNEEQALNKIKQIERNIKDSILHETTTIRTKNAITIASQYPTRHVQIVLRLYDSISQIITGFDVDCACAAYDGGQVYAAPRAIAAFITQCNTIDLTRRSPSYENRLSKYSRRGFEVHWSLLDRTRIDPTIFERSFGRTQGLAKLLILEKLPKSDDRDDYMNQRRAERGRPQLHRNHHYHSKMFGNIKDQEEDEVAEWVDQQEVASYHTMTVPYGPKYHAAKINRLLYAKDLLLNAEWNQPDDRHVYLHRHPCFFGTAEEVLQDCCGYCPVPETDEEIVAADEESKTNISGELHFLVDDPGRQEIGSFHPITDDEWTTMAYVGDTARLCQAIVDGDLEHVEDWCSQPEVDVNRRDYTGRTPLHLATMTSSVEIVSCLINHGARLIARLVDGRTALHIAAARGDADMVNILMMKSSENEEQEEEKEETRRAARIAAKHKSGENELDASDTDSEASEITLGSESESESDSDSVTMGSFVKIDTEKQKKADDGVPDDSLEDPDVYDIDVIAWDYGLSPLHLAILNGHLDIIELLVSEYGADVLLPVKLLEPGTTNARGAIMTILLAVTLPTEKAKEVVELLLRLGATSTQGDMNHFSILHYIVAADNHEIINVLLDNDRPAALSVLNNVAFTSHWNHNVQTPLVTAVTSGYQDMVLRLLELGASPTIDFNDWVKGYLSKKQWARSRSPEKNMEDFQTSVYQPIIAAACNDMGKTVRDLLNHGADPATLEKTAYRVVRNPESGNYTVTESLLDIIQKKLKLLREYKEPDTDRKPEKLRAQTSYTYGLTEGTYEYWNAVSNHQQAEKLNKQAWALYEHNLKYKTQEGNVTKKEAIAELIAELESTERTLIEAGSQSFREMYPDITEYLGHRNQFPWRQSDPVPYETTVKFQVPDLNDIKKDGYLKLFEASWSNDLETVKSLTLAQWTWLQSSSPNTPLKIAVQDANGFSPFSIATLRGHRDLARKIVEICIAQYHENDGKTKRQRWNMRAGDADDEDYDNDDDDDNLPISSELVHNEFTVDFLGEVSNIVKSDVLPRTMIEWACYPHRLVQGRSDNDGCKTLLEHAAYTNDMDLLEFIIELGSREQARLAEDDDSQKCYTINGNAFSAAIKHGHTAILAEMIKATGVGIPFNELVKKSGVEIKSKPKYYQGLTVGGKKRADWAQAPGDNHVQVAEQKIPPLLQAAHDGNIDSVEWFMSDAPMRRYAEFADANKHDERIKALEVNGDGFGMTLKTWLNAKSELILHCAILYPQGMEDRKYLKLIEHILSVMPECLEQKSSEGWTPLQVAVLTRRTPVAAYLINCGANQRCRSKVNGNVIHSIVDPQGVGNSGNYDARKIEGLIELFEKEAVKEMMLERCTIAPGSLTPLAYWMSENRGRDKTTDVITVLCKYSNGEELKMINGEGDLPLHVAIKQGLSTITSFLLSQNPSLLYRESATGRTPLEMAREMYTASRVEDPPRAYASFFYSPGSDHISLLQKRADEFLKRKQGPEESRKRTWQICEDFDQKLADVEGVDVRKRRLVSLFEANEVAKRLAGRSTAGHSGKQVVVNGGIVNAEVKKDIVSEWVGMACRR